MITKKESEMVMETDFPVNLLWDYTLYVAIRKALDSDRAQELMDSVLTSIVENQAKTVIFDIMGVEVIDTAVANHIINMGSAMKLLGCQMIISGISPVIAQTIVHLGVDLSGIVSLPTTKDALTIALDTAGYEIKKAD